MSKGNKKSKPTSKKKSKTIEEKKTRKITAGLFISLDGVTQAPNEWQETFDEDMGIELQKTLANQDAILMGRKLYEEWVQFWPNNSDDPFADWINNVEKFVVSSTLEKVEWGEFGSISLLRNLDQVKELKKTKGKNIGMSGSSTLVLSLLKEGILDELFLMIHPVIVGKGAKLFKEDQQLKRLELVDSKKSRSGVIIAKYIPKRN